MTHFSVSNPFQALVTPPSDVLNPSTHSGRGSRNPSISSATSMKVTPSISISSNDGNSSFPSSSYAAARSAPIPSENEPLIPRWQHTFINPDHHASYHTSKLHGADSDEEEGNSGSINSRQRYSQISYSGISSNGSAKPALSLLPNHQHHHYCWNSIYAKRDLETSFALFSQKPLIFFLLRFGSIYVPDNATFFERWIWFILIRVFLIGSDVLSIFSSNLGPHPGFGMASGTELLEVDTHIWTIATLITHSAMYYLFTRNTDYIISSIRVATQPNSLAYIFSSFDSDIYSVSDFPESHHSNLTHEEALVEPASFLARKQCDMYMLYQVQESDTLHPLGGHGDTKDSKVELARLKLLNNRISKSWNWSILMFSILMVVNISGFVLTFSKPTSEQNVLLDSLLMICIFFFYSVSFICIGIHAMFGCLHYAACFNLQSDYREERYDLNTIYGNYLGLLKLMRKSSTWVFVTALPLISFSVMDIAISIFTVFTSKHSLFADRSLANQFVLSMSYDLIFLLGFLLPFVFLNRTASRWSWLSDQIKTFRYVETPVRARQLFWTFVSARSINWRLAGFVPMPVTVLKTFGLILTVFVALLRIGK